MLLQENADFLLEGLFLFGQFDIHRILLDITNAIPIRLRIVPATI
jgi:hypothetical protein